MEAPEDSKPKPAREPDFFDWSKDYIRGKNTRNDAIAFWIFFVIVLIAIIVFFIMIHNSPKPLSAIRSR